MRATHAISKIEQKSQNRIPRELDQTFVIPRIGTIQFTSVPPFQPTHMIRALYYIGYIDFIGSRLCIKRIYGFIEVSRSHNSTQVLSALENI